MRELLVRGTPPREIAVIEEGKLVEYLLAGTSAENGAIYLGRVDRVLSGMNAAFVNIGEDKKGFLPLGEDGLPPASLHSGDAILVQVKREAQGTKGALLSRNLSLAGSYVILMPLVSSVGISAKIQDEKERARLHDMALTLTDGRFGLVMRTSSQSASLQVLKQETTLLWNRWEGILQETYTRKAPCLIASDGDLLKQAMRDFQPMGIDRIVTEHAEDCTFVKDVPVEQTTRDPMQLYGIDHELEKALQRRVWLKSGANLVIDPCEAMTVIDVNTAKFTGKRHHADRTLVRTNLEACDEIARQIRLRALGGIILIDMIDMESEADRAEVLQHLKDVVARDRVKTVVHGFTSLGLIEMTRKRTRKSLREALGDSIRNQSSHMPDHEEGKA